MQQIVINYNKKYPHIMENHLKSVLFLPELKKLYLVLKSSFPRKNHIYTNLISIMDVTSLEKLQYRLNIYDIIWFILCHIRKCLVICLMDLNFF